MCSSDLTALAAATTEELEPQIHSTGFFRAKSKALIGMAQALVRDHKGEVPADIDALTKLPGVGRKTANVVLGHALGVPGLPVDRHVLRDDPGIGAGRERAEPLVGLFSEMGFSGHRNDDGPCASYAPHFVGQAVQGAGAKGDAVGWEIAHKRVHGCLVLNGILSI